MKTQMSFKKRNEIYEFLKTVCQSVEGFAVYQSGWSDAAVADHLKVTPANVYSIRKEMFGKIATVTVATSGSLETRVAQLEHQVARLLQKLGLEPLV